MVLRRFLSSLLVVMFVLVPAVGWSCVGILLLLLALWGMLRWSWVYRLRSTGGGSGGLMGVRFLVKWIGVAAVSYTHLTLPTTPYV